MPAPDRREQCPIRAWCSCAGCADNRTQARRRPAAARRATARPQQPRRRSDARSEWFSIGGPHRRGHRRHGRRLRRDARRYGSGGLAMNVTIIGVPYALDQPYTGMVKAPHALLDAGLVQRLEALGCTTILAEMVDIAPSEEPHEERLGHLLARLGYEVARAHAAGFFPLVLGGDCLTSLGTLAGLLDPAVTGIAWFDAHGDFNTPEISLSGYLGGMPLACAVGRGLDDLRARSKMAAPVAERNVALIGARDLDPLEERALAASSVMLVRASALDGDTADLDRAIHNLGALSQVYLHV